MKSMLKMIFLHFKYAELKGERILCNGLTVDNVNEYSFAELNHIFETDQEILTIQKLLK